MKQFPVIGLGNPYRQYILVLDTHRIKIIMIGGDMGRPILAYVTLYEVPAVRALLETVLNIYHYHHHYTHDYNAPYYPHSKPGRRR